MLEKVLGIKRSKELKEFGKVLEKINHSKFIASKMILEGFGGPEIDNLDSEWHLKAINKIEEFKTIKPHYEELANSLRGYLIDSRREIQEFKKYLINSGLVSSYENLALNQKQIEKFKPKTFENVYALAKKIDEKLKNQEIDLNKVKLGGHLAILKAVNN